MGNIINQAIKLFF